MTSATQPKHRVERGLNGSVKNGVAYPSDRRSPNARFSRMQHPNRGSPRAATTDLYFLPLLGPFTAEECFRADETNNAFKFLENAIDTIIPSHDRQYFITYRPPYKLHIRRDGVNTSIDPVPHPYLWEELDQDILPSIKTTLWIILKTLVSAITAHLMVVSNSTQFRLYIRQLIPYDHGLVDVPFSFARHQDHICQAKCLRIPQWRIPSPRTHVHRLMQGTTLPSVEEYLEIRDINQPKTKAVVCFGPMFGQQSLKNWRRAAGKTKSWKRCPKIKTVGQNKYIPPKRSSSKLQDQFTKSILWLPTEYICLTSPRRGGMLRSQVSDRVPERAKRVERDFQRYEDWYFKSHKRCSAKSIMHGDTAVDPEADDISDRTTEPGAVFIRITWKDSIIINGVGQVNRFLPTGLAFSSGWQVLEFLRNDSHTDVYSVRHPSFDGLSATVELRHEAHVFLDEYHGNCANYARRLKNRLRASEDCLNTWLYGGRHVYILRIKKKVVSFQLRKSYEEFPILVDQETCNESTELQQHCFRDKPSFAMIVEGKHPKVESASKSTRIPKIVATNTRKNQRTLRIIFSSSGSDLHMNINSPTSVDVLEGRFQSGKEVERSGEAFKTNKKEPEPLLPIAHQLKKLEAVQDKVGEEHTQEVERIFKEIENIVKGYREEAERSQEVKALIVRTGSL